MLYIRLLGVEPSYNSLWKYDAVDDTQTSTLLPTTTSDASPYISSNADHDAISTDTLTAPLFEITSLPPATTSAQISPKLPYHSQVNILYLIPLFITLGVVLGAITAAILLKCREHRARFRRTSTLLPGPPYVSRENDVEDRLLVHGHPSMEQVSLFAASTPSKFTVHGSRYVPQRMLGWKAFDTTQPLPVYAQPAYNQTIIPSGNGETFTVVTHEDPFTLPPLNGVQESVKTSAVSSLSQIRISPSLPHSTSEVNSNIHHTQEANLPKSFRRSMFDILKRKSPYRPVPSLDKEDAVLAPQVNKTFTDRVRRVSSLKATTETAGASRPRSKRRSLDGGLQVGNMDNAVGLLGSQDDKQNGVDSAKVLPKQAFHIKQGRMSSPALGDSASRPRNVAPFASEISQSPKEAMHDEDHPTIQPSGDDTEEEKHADNYTRAPQRRRTRTSLQRSSAGSTPRRSSAPDGHASVLPPSPPSVMSPPLARTLFFTSSLSSSASLAGRMHTLAAMSTPSLERRVDESPSLKHSLSVPASPSSRKTRTRLRTANRPSPPMPFPSYPDHINADRKTTTTAVETVTTRATRPTSSMNAYVRTLPPRRPVSPGSPSPKARMTRAMTTTTPTSEPQRASTTGEDMYSLGSFSLSPTSLAIALASSSSEDVLNDKINDIVERGYIYKRTSSGDGGGNGDPSGVV